MDPVTLIVGALATGTAAGVGATANQAVADAYASLKAAVAARFVGRPQAEEALEAHLADPASHDTALAVHLREVGADRDPRIVALAEELVRVLESSGLRRAEGSIDLRHAQGVQLGDGNYQTNTFG